MGRVKIDRKIERWQTLFDGMPSFRCDVVTLIVKVNKLTKVVEVEKQFWFKRERSHFYNSSLAVKRARGLYKLISQGGSGLDCGYRNTPTSTMIWFNMKVYG